MEEKYGRRLQLVRKPYLPAMRKRGGKEEKLIVVEKCSISLEMQWN